MTAPPLNRLRNALALLPGLLTFACLGGLLFWGHHSHWKLPAFKDLQRYWTGAAAEDGADAGPPIRLIARPASADAATLAHLEVRSAETFAKAGVQFAPAQERALERYVTANGNVDYDQTLLAQLSSRVPGSVWSVERHVGDPVKKGDVLAVVEAADVGKAKAEFLSALVHLDLKSQILRHYKPASVPLRLMQEGEADVREARIRLFNAQQALNNLGLPIKSEDFSGAADEAVSRKLRLLGLPPATLRGLDPETASANLLPLLAPFDGVVVGRNTVVGELVAPNSPQFEVADVRRLWITVEVRLEDADQIAVGQPLLFSSDSAPGKLVRGVVSWVSTSADPKTRTVQVRADVENADGKLRANTFGTGQIVVQVSPHAVTVPASAVQRLGGDAVVFVRDDERTVAARKVQLGIRNGEHVEILAGVHLDEEVATAGSHVLKSEILKQRQSADEE